MEDFDAVCEFDQALAARVGVTLDITLRAVEEMRPVFMDQPMFIVVVDVAFGEDASLAIHR